MENEDINQAEIQAEPSNLEDAIKLLREKDQTTAAENVEDTGSNEAGTEVGGQEGFAGSVGGEDTQDGSGIEHESSVQLGEPGEVGGSADSSFAAEAGNQVGYSTDDYRDIQSRILDSVRRQAALATNEKFRQEGIEKVTLTQLYQRDEDTGRVTFHNPDDPDNPFESRAQAQAWVDSYNSQIEAEWVNYANQMQQQFATQTLPAMRLVAFAPVYDSMNPRVQKYFDAIIENYGVSDSTGALIGYSCDLNAAYVQAQKLAAIDGGTEVSETKNAGGQTIASTPSGPALDATTSGSDTSSNKPAEPKNLNEAFKMINKAKKGKK